MVSGQTYSLLAHVMCGSRRICCDWAEAGSVPRQHAWVVDALADDGHQVELAPFHAPEERKRLDSASGGMLHALGQLDQEWHGLHSGADTFYSADQRSARGLILASKRPV